MEPHASTSILAAEDRQYWLQVARGQLKVVPASDATMSTLLSEGDGLGFRQRGDIVIEALDLAEVLLFDLPIG